MEYVSLYRRWRPRKFAEVVGQRHVVLTLQRAIAQGRVGHAYLFAGPRGTGKTTVARILAKALNCRRGPAPEPCLECDMCQSIAAGSCLDVIEMDAASNRGVDEVRHLRENVGLAPAQGRTRVYIIDEVHMLTTEAFNALLKTLEEPPRHVLFVLATTEPHRLPLTITSRCQRFEFRRLDATEMTERLWEVARQEGIPVSEEALGAVARYAEGSLRDAISLLDQLMAYSGEGITQETVWAVLGRAPLDLMREMGRALAGGDAALLLGAVEQAALRGLDMRQVLRDLAAYLRDLSVLVSCGDGTTLLYLPPGEAAGAREEAAVLPPARWWELATALARAEAEVRWTSQPRLALELALLRLVADRGQGQAPQVQAAASGQPRLLSAARAQASAQPQMVQAAQVEAARPQAVAPAPPAQPQPGVPTHAVPAEAQVGGVRQPGPAGATSVAGASGGVSLQEVWQQVLSVLDRTRGRKFAAACLREGKPLGLEGKRFLVGFSPHLATLREQLEHTYRGAVEQVLAQVVGHECRLVCTQLVDDATVAGVPADSGAGVPAGADALPVTDAAPSVPTGREGAAPAAAPGAGNGAAAGLDRGGESRRERAGVRGAASVDAPDQLDEVVQRAWCEWGGYILDLEREGAP
ncbi:MAG: DNA polymerase III subunit gamma/tau [Bacillota bacterium]|nr:DNA polymerase III subunit gamma/tau [Bacillota bacterium]